MNAIKQVIYVAGVLSTFALSVIGGIATLLIIAKAVMVIFGWLW